MHHIWKLVVDFFASKKKASLLNDEKLLITPTESTLLLLGIF